VHVLYLIFIYILSVGLVWLHFCADAELQLLSNPELIRQTVQNPIVRELMMNPAVLNELVTSYPQAKEWLKVVIFCCLL